VHALVGWAKLAFMSSSTARTGPRFLRERSLIAAQLAPVAGIDEAGRGPWAGPVVAAAVILDPEHIPEGLDDSKALTPAARCSVLFVRHNCQASATKSSSR